MPMGKKDILLKDYFTPERFADAINAIVFKGKKIRILIEPSDKLLYCFKMKLGTRYVGAKTIMD